MQVRTFIVVLFVAAYLSVALPAIAHAAFVSAAVVGFLGLAGTVAGSIIASAISIGLSIGLSYLGQALLGETAEAPTKPRFPGFKGELEASGVRPRSFIIGEWATAGSLVYANTWGDSSETPNGKIVQVIALSDLPVEEISDFKVDDQNVSFNPAGSQAGNGYAISQYHKGGNDHLWFRTRDGTQVVDDAYLNDKFGSDPDRPWPTTRVGTGVAYVTMTARVNDKLYAGFPSLKAVVKGVFMYDLRNDTTAGGSGAERWDTPATWGGYSANPVIQIYNILRGIKFAGDWMWGGQTLTAASLPYSNWAAAANACDEAVDLAAGGTEPRYRAGSEISVNETPLDVIQRLLKACNGRLAEAGGTYKIHVGVAGTSVFSITDDDIIVTEGQSFEPLKGLDTMVNGISANYISPGQGWAPKSAPPRRSPTFEAKDGGRRAIVSIDYEAVSSKTQCQRLMLSALLEERRERKHIITLPPEALVLEPNDFIDWTSDRNGYAAKLFRIDLVTEHPNGCITVALTEVDPDDYDWDETVDEADDDDSTIVLPAPAAAGVASLAFAGATATLDNGFVRAAVAMSFTAGTDDVDDIDVEVIRSTTVTITIATPGVVTWSSHGFSGNEEIVFQTSGALPTGITAGTPYYVLAASLTGSTFRIAATAGGSAINTSGSQSGTHKAAATAAVVKSGAVGPAAVERGAAKIQGGAIVSATAYQARARPKMKSGIDASWSAWMPVTTPTVQFLGAEVADDQIDTPHVILEAINAGQYDEDTTPINIDAADGPVGGGPSITMDLVAGEMVQIYNIIHVESNANRLSSSRVNIKIGGGVPDTYNPSRNSWDTMGYSAGTYNRWQTTVSFYIATATDTHTFTVRLDGEIGNANDYDVRALAVIRVKR